MVSTGRELFDTFYDRAPDLVSDAQLLPAWSPDGKSLAFVTGPADDRRGWLVDLATGEKTPLVDITRVREAVRDATGQTPAGRGLPFAHVAFAGPRTLMTQVGADTLLVDLDTVTVSKTPADSMLDTMLGQSERARRTPREYWRTQPLIDPQKTPETASPDGAFLISTRDGNIVLRSSYDGRETPLTRDGTPEHEWRFDMFNPMLALLGMAVPVTNFSPDGTRLAAYRVDNRGVAQLPQVHYLKREDEVVPRYHGKAGGVLERYSLHILDVYGRPAVDIDLGDTTDTYPVFAGWLHDGSQVLVARVSRDCRRVDVLLADAVTGDVRELFSEVGETFVRIHHDVYFGRKLGLWLTPNGRHVLWLSERSGWKHIYEYKLDGQLVRQLTDGEWPVDDVKSFDDGFVYFTAHHDQDRPYDLHVCRVPFGGGPVERLTTAEGVHVPVFSPSGEVFIDAFSTPAKAPAHELRRVDGESLGVLLTADTSRLEDLGWTPPRQFTVKAADGETDLWGVMFFPAGFDSSRRYPVIEYVYGGPQLAVAPHQFAGTFGRHAEALAQLGYVTVVLDGRGTPERSKAFHDVVYRNWAGHLADDHAAAIKQLAERETFLDIERGVGVIGHSWGGYTAFRLLADRPDVYAAAVSSAPGFDPYSSVLYECYLGLPQHNKAAYDAAQTLTRAGQVQGDVLIVCGTSDHATWTDAIKMSEALIRAGKQHEFVVMPEQYHGYDSVHDDYFWRKVISFFEQRLQPPS